MGLPVYKRAINIYLHGGVSLFLRRLLWSILLRLYVFMSPVVFAKLEMFFILVPCNIITFVFTINMISWHQITDGGCHVAKISSHFNKGGTKRT